jgi:hypothetical protein
MNSSSITYPVNIFDKIIIGIYQYIGISLYISANLGNIFNALIFSQKSWRKNVCVFYFLICLILDSININSSMLGFIFIYGFNINLTNSNVILCKIFTYLTFFLPTLSATILVLASIDRLLISSQNVDTRLYSSKRLAYFSISLSTGFWFIFFFHILIKLNIEQLGPLIFICAFNSAGFYADFIAYSMLIINVFLFVMIIILSILAFKNVRQIQSIPRQQRSTIHTMRKKDFQLLRCLFAKDIVYIFCNILLCMYSIYKIIIDYQKRTIWEQAIDTFIFNVGSFIYQIPSCVNFFIYVIVSKAFRQGLKRLIWKIFRNDLTSIREEHEHN